MFFVKICSLVVAACAMLMSSFRPLPEVKPMPVEQDGSFTPVLRFVASSDSHVKGYADTGVERIMKMIQTGYAAAEADSSYKKLDAAVVVGDVTNYGLPTTFFSVKAGVDAVLRDGTDFLAVAAENHDSYLGRISRAYIAGITEDTADFHKVINGYHFIGVSASPTSIIHYTKRQIKWLDEQLAAAVRDDAQKPVFVFQHEHIENTVFGSLPDDGWGESFFTDVLNKYPQVVNISGHSHYPANDPRSIWQDTFTAINDGGLAYYEFTIDGVRSQHPESSNNMAQCLLVEADAQNRVRVRVCDLNAEEVMCEYLLDNITEPHKTKYAHETRRQAATAPVFNEAPQVDVDGSTAIVTVKPASVGADDVVYIYRLQMLNEKGETVATAKKLGDYYKTLTPGDIELSVSLSQKGNYTAVVTAEDAWGKTSEPVSVPFVF